MRDMWPGDNASTVSKANRCVTTSLRWLDFQGDSLGLGYQQHDPQAGVQEHIHGTWSQ